MVAGQVGDHLAAVGAEVGGEPPVDVGRHDRRVGRPAEHATPAPQALGEREVVELVQLVPAQRLPRALGDLLRLAVAAVVHVPAVAGLAGAPPAGRRPRRQQRLQHLADLAADGAHRVTRRRAR